MPVDTNDPRPAYAQVADGLRLEIESGELAAGTKLPSGRDLAKQWGVALMTLQKAIDQLRDEGLVFAQQGRGVFVTSPDSRPVDDLVALRAVVEKLQRRVDRLEAHVEIDEHQT